MSETIERPYILHMFTATPQMSPFDVNMAADAGYQVIVPYCNVEAGMVANLTQDAIFSRGPKGVSRTGIFIGGRDVMQAVAMLDTARRAMVPPFEVSVFADPSGSYTTAAALVALVERHLGKQHGVELGGKSIGPIEPACTKRRSPIAQVSCSAKPIRCARPCAPMNS
ncbi:methylene-tetrahydromethanopterin dehydrogenase N-terminal domain-containing protein, partial [Paraburkholderia sp. BR10954]|uniref:methylene-tetrahydromethanopterin dehydrogenase N-terminal domain-containing protein n=1 Tax=Paraburkholderia sp. BR10954 TaxID=3236995 RepID=UPI0034D19B98